jgi:hypothetical protein
MMDLSSILEATFPFVGTVAILAAATWALTEPSTTVSTLGTPHSGLPAGQELSKAA